MCIYGLHKTEKLRATVYSFCLNCLLYEECTVGRKGSNSGSLPRSVSYSQITSTLCRAGSVAQRVSEALPNVLEEWVPYSSL